MTVVDIISAIAELDRNELPAVLAACAARLAESSNGTANSDDELVDVSEAARILGRSESYLYHARNLPFAVRVGKRGRRFSRCAIQRFIEKQQGKM